MATYARIIGNVVRVVQGQEGYDRTDPRAQEYWAVVPDDVVAWSTVNEDGSYTPPPTPQG